VSSKLPAHVLYVNSRIIVQVLEILEDLLMEWVRAVFLVRPTCDSFSTGSCDAVSNTLIMMQVVLPALAGLILVDLVT